MPTRDRRAAVLQSLTTNGIDFVEVANQAQTLLRLHFLNAVNVEGSLTGAPTITGGETIPSVMVLPIDAGDWGWDDGHAVLTLSVAAPGDFSTYILTVPSGALDPFFAQAAFSFKAGCPSDLDCETPAAICPPVAGDAPPIDYQAKDFLSFRQALLDFSTLRYPAWQERSEADFGIMFLEALSAVADELSYTQDRVANEASLLTATQRVSVQRHARFVDYELKPAVAATTWLQFDVAPGVDAIAHGQAVMATATDGVVVTFETGLGFRDASPPPLANALWNRGGISPYWYDDSKQCLQTGATQMYLLGRGYDFQPGQMLLIETEPESSADPPVRQVVRLLPPGDPGGPWTQEQCDDLFESDVTTGPPYMTCPTPPGALQGPTAVTMIAWQAADQLKVARDLARTKVIGNIANATQGRTMTAEVFAIRPPATGLGDPIVGAAERTGPRPWIAPGVCGDAPAIRLYTLANAPLTWLKQPGADSTGQALPEIMLTQTQLGAASTLPPVSWSWFYDLLEAGQFDNAFTIDPLAYRTLAANSNGSWQSDYDGDAGDTIRFGDGVFGANPDPGMLFAATYRYGGGSVGNVAPGAISQLDPVVIARGELMTVMNPLSATGGKDAQSLQSAKRLAPQKFRADPQPRAVLAADYSAAAQTQAWVQRAGTVFRWTGSWLTTFTTPQPKGTEQIAIGDRTSLIDLLNRYRMAGTESYVPDPDYVSIDVVIELCAAASAFAAQVQQGVTAALSPTGPGAATAFFAIGRFGFGQPLERSALEAAVQAVPGVAGVTCINFRLRDLTAGFMEMRDTVPVGANQILRCDNDPNRPNNGALTVTVGGGR